MSIQPHVIASAAWQSPRVLIGKNSYEIATSFLLAMTYLFESYLMCYHPFHRQSFQSYPKNKIAGINY